MVNYWKIKWDQILGKSAFFFKSAVKVKSTEFEVAGIFCINNNLNCRFILYKQRLVPDEYIWTETICVKSNLVSGKK